VTDDRHPRGGGPAGGVHPDDLEPVVLDDPPRLCALYRDPDEDEPSWPLPTGGPHRGVVGWVLAWPDGSAVALITEDERLSVVVAPLSSVQRRWAALHDATLVRVVPA
jgi:hypothetical protein